MNLVQAGDWMLDAAWERDGYWYFRDVLDEGALAAHGLLSVP
jgi:hypothetical protein